jgi:hypothetical protein
MPLLTHPRIQILGLAACSLLGCAESTDTHQSRNATGGTVATGGNDAASGGSLASGGSNDSAEQGGDNAGGVRSTGGVTSTGGVRSTGGVTSTGGIIATGGTTSTGGAAVTGGATTNAGGRYAAGGRNVAGSRNTGGVTSTGGATSAAGATGVAGSACANGPLTTSIANCVITAPPSTGDYHQDCVDTINKIRWDCMCLPPLARWTDGEACADQMATYDAGQGSAHAGFIARLCSPGGSAQCECPGWNSVSSITQGTSRMESCLSMMWHEVDDPAGEQGHYQAMSSKTYTKVACGINSSTSDVWAAQNYSR